MPPRNEPGLSFGIHAVVLFALAFKSCYEAAISSRDQLKSTARAAPRIVIEG